MLPLIRSIRLFAAPPGVGTEAFEQFAPGLAVRIEALDAPQPGLDAEPREKGTVAAEAERDLEVEIGGAVSPNTVGGHEAAMQFTARLLRIDPLRHFEG
ncbi:hypothetical protein [Kitasatospora purpeofusca]|uniref:Uncharacterized protein n=1 Tax=Kitasatospora purpeofusca TaxID=67352 RepID=A0ABZ1UB28_9ACTN|nr:hypothetical protein [Kitasatospora purpeofusca]